MQKSRSVSQSHDVTTVSQQELDRLRDELAEKTNALALCEEERNNVRLENEKLRADVVSVRDEYEMQLLRAREAQNETNEVLENLERMNETLMDEMEKVQSQKEARVIDVNNHGDDENGAEKC